MAITTTPLGFKKPDGRELVKNMDDVISTNAQKAQDLISSVRADIALLKANGGGGGGGSGFVEDPDNPGFYLVEASTVGLVEDPDNPGFYLVNGA